MIPVIIMTADTGTREKLLECGTIEFLGKGYEKASLRKICESAGVTTGALYFFFDSKAGLFECIVGTVATELRVMLARHTEEEIAGKRTSEETDGEFVEFLYANRDVAAILLRKASGSPFEGFFDELCQNLRESFMRYFVMLGGSREEGKIIDILVKMRIESYIQLLENGSNLEETLALSKLLARYCDSGFIEMMNMYTKRLG